MPSGSWHDEFVKIDCEWFFSLHRIHNQRNPRTFTAGQKSPVKQLEDRNAYFKRRSVSSIGRSLMLAKRFAISPFSSNSQFSLPYDRYH
jgi:hypothetical protein